MKKVLIASIAPASVVAARGVIIAGGNGPVKGIRIAGVVIEDHHMFTDVLAERGVEVLQQWRSCLADTKVLSKIKLK